MSFITDCANIPGSTQLSVDVSNPDSLVVKNSQDCTAILENNKRLHRQAGEDGGYGPTREWKRAASVPLIIAEKWLREDGIRFWDSEDSDAFLRKLDDPENLFLRTAPGRLSRNRSRTYCKASSGR